MLHCPAIWDRWNETGGCPKHSRLLWQKIRLRLPDSTPFRLISARFGPISSSRRQQPKTRSAALSYSSPLSKVGAWAEL